MPLYTFELPAVFRPGHYTACYLLAVATYQLLLLLEGRRRGFPLRPWLLMQAATLLAFVVGCKLVALPLADWPSLGPGGAALTAYPVRSALGGIAASSLVLLALRRWLGLGWAAFDAFVGPLAAGLAVQCLGCLAAGCCWGELASGDLGLCFGPGTGPYAAQVARGLLPAGAPHALPVVPTQLYGLLLCLALAGATWATRRRAWPAGTRYLLGTGALLLAWGGLCQWRDPASQTLGAQPLALAGVRLLAIQWSVLAVGLLHLAGAALLLWWGTVFSVVRAAPSAPQPARQLAGAAALLALTAALAPHALTGAEFRVLQVALGALLLAEAAAWWPALAATGWRGQPRLAFAATLALLVLMSQAPAPRQDSVRSVDFSVGATQGTFDQDFDYNATTSGGGCGGGGSYPVAPSRDGYLHRYRTAGGQVAVQLKPEGNGPVGTVGMAVWGGTDQVGFAPQTPGSGPLQTDHVRFVRNYSLLDINPYFEGQGRTTKDFRIGYRVGFHVGNLLNNQASRKDSTLEAKPLLPDLQLWVGNRRLLFAQADAGYGAGGVGNYLYRIGLGSGLGSSKGGNVVAGLAFSNVDSHSFSVGDIASNERPASTTLGFAAANIRLANSGFSLEPTAVTDFGRHHQVSLRLHYRLGLKK